MLMLNFIYFTSQNETSLHLKIAILLHRYWVVNNKYLCPLNSALKINDDIHE